MDRECYITWLERAIVQSNLDRALDRSMKDDAEYQLSLLRTRVKELESERMDLLKRIDEMEGK